MFKFKKPQPPLICDQHQLSILKQGVAAWAAWRKNHPNDEIQLANAPLERMDLAGVDLGKADLRSANLLGANLSKAVLNDADLSAATLTEADLTGASLCRTKIISTNFWYANLSDAKTISLKYTKRGMKNNFFGVRGVESTWGDALFKRMAADQAYLDSVQWHWNKNLFKRILFCAWGWIDYGRGLYRILFMALIFIAIFGGIYAHCPDMVGLNCTPKADKCALHGYFTPFYFSVVTYTTLGFGDISAQTTGGEIAVAVEVLLGYLTLGLLSSVLADKVARRS